MQFDLFNPSDSVALRNDVVLAFEKGHAPAARAAWQALKQKNPQDTCLAAFELLVQAQEQHSLVAYPDHDALRDACLDLTRNLTPAARSCLGQQASAWLGLRWRALAQRAGGLAYRADRPNDHAAPAWLQAGDWQACSESVLTIASWRRIPTPMSWMLQARLKLQGLLTNWGLLAELAWMSPQRLQGLLTQSDDPILQALVAKFELNFEGTGDGQDLAWFPAWVLTERPALARALTQAQAGQHTEPEQALRVMLELLGLERQGRQRDLVEARKSLRILNQALYTAYMATR
jgi:hypothetical protein